MFTLDDAIRFAAKHEAQIRLYNRLATILAKRFGTDSGQYRDTVTVMQSRLQKCMLCTAHGHTPSF